MPKRDAPCDVTAKGNNRLSQTTEARFKSEAQVGPRIPLLIEVAPASA